MRRSGPTAKSSPGSSATSCATSPITGRCSTPCWRRSSRGLGYAIDRRGDTDWEIAGVPQAVIDLFSKRTAQIEAVARKRGITDEARKAELGAETRGKKQKELTMPELRQAWRAQLTDEDREALARVYARQVQPGQAVTAAEAVEFALAHCSEKLSVIPERELKRVALLFGLGSLAPEDDRPRNARAAARPGRPGHRRQADGHDRSAAGGGAHHGRVCRRRPRHGGPGRAG